MKFDNIISHPDKEEIIKKLFLGLSAKSVSDWLKTKYSTQETNHLRLSQKTIQDFIDSGYLNAYDKLKEDVVATKQGRNLDDKIADSLLNSKTYRERINELADDKIDVKKKIVQMETLISSRFEQVFDRIQSDPSSIGAKGDYALIKYYEQWIKTIEFYNKAIDLAPTNIVQHNHTVEYIDKRTSYLQEAIRELLFEMEPEMASKFWEKLQNKLNNFSYKEQTPEQITIGKIEQLEASFLNEETNIDG